ncbi:hypothetical protein QYM36_017648 [Artemia franciscana]|uniref:Uncharacterized protein n=1 Tax=Artemia franciscana TaxID=6661 RepID=A0AA88HAR9_ARTSF|nr:hypothetical protein QYM36_017648 [Artemia franciscana]
MAASVDVSSEIIRQCCQLDDLEVSESVADGDEDEQSNEEASKSQSGKVDDIDNESEGSISNLFISNQKEVRDNEANVTYFKLDRTSEPEKATHHSVFDLFTERKESLSINDLHVDTAALRQVDYIDDQVASEAGKNNTDVKSEKRSHGDAEDLNKTNMVSNIQVAKDNNPFVNIETLQKTYKEPLPTLLRLNYSRDVD